MKYYASIGNIDKNNNKMLYVRFLNSVPNRDNIVIYINDIKAIPVLDYREFTEYHKALSGIYNIKVYSEERTKNIPPLCNKEVKLESDTIYTIAVSGEPNHLDINIISDTQRVISPNKLSMRYINLSNEASDLDITMNSITQVSDISYSEVSKYTDLSPGTYVLNAYISGSKDKILTVPNIKLKPGKFYATYIIGNMDKDPKLQVLLPLEGASYLKF